MSEVFTWCPEKGTTGDDDTDILVSQFRNGYSQRLSVGINNISTSWPVTFMGKTDYIVPIRDFFVRHKGVTHFLWTPPLHEQGAFVTDGGWSLQPLGAGVYILSTKFQQVFNP